MPSFERKQKATRRCLFWGSLTVEAWVEGKKADCAHSFRRDHGVFSPYPGSGSTVSWSRRLELAGRRRD
jgi:hypothetical protein